MARLHHHLRNAFIPHSGNDYQPHALRRPWLHTYTAIIVAVKVVMVLTVSIYASPARVSDVTPTTIIQLTNAQRVQKKIGTLATNPLLTKAAEKKAADMAQRNYFAHVSPTGLTPWYWFKQAGYSYTYAGENLAIDFISSEDVVAAWLKSPSHRANLLSTKYKDIGVAVRTAKIDGAAALIVVQMFGAPVKATVKTVTVPTQQPTPAKAKAIVQSAPVVPTAPPPVVLGEASQDLPIPPPTIVTPSIASLVRTAQPEIVGQTLPGAIVTLYVQGVHAATTTADTHGGYSVTPDTALHQGTTAARTTATLNGKTSDFSAEVPFAVDSEAPTIDISRSVVLPSYLDASGYIVEAVVTGQPQDVRIGTIDRSVAATMNGDTYNAMLSVPPNSIPGPIRIRARDAAGNETNTILADPSIFTTGVVASTNGPFFNAVRIVFFSRSFIFLFLMMMTIMAAMNVIIEWRHQHHPTIVHSVLVMFLAATLLML